ncbi:MAG: hypothetical protein QME90_16500 [Thermodesulfobacteriota bacterium]|nr:hypothetical protein [Thermodesulfobacteriota bacterium]
MEVKKGDGAVLKIGDRFKDKTTGKIYIIKMEIDNRTLLPNPDIEKIDIGDHEDLERFFLN